MTQPQENLTIQIQKVSLEELEQYAQLEEENTPICTLFWTEDGQDVKLLFYSNQKSIRPLEFMDFFVQEYVLVQGNEKTASAVLTPFLLQSMMSEFEAASTKELFETLVDAYFSKCTWIYADAYAKEQKEQILQMQKYTKKKITWAFVKTTDIVEDGKTFYLKSLENESEITLTASPDLYVMIGKLGEIYHIRKECFDESYETLEEPIDPLEQMFIYFPEIRACDSGEFITLDDLAFVCWPKVNGGIYASRLECRTKVFNPYNADEYFVGRKGDYLAIRQGDLSDIYIIKQNIFEETYEKTDFLS